MQDYHYSYFFQTWINFAHFRTLYKWNHIVCSFSCKAYFTQNFVSLFFFTQYKETTICLSILLLSIWVVSSFWLLWVNLLWKILVQLFLWAYIFITLEKYLGMKLMGHSVDECVEETIRPISKVATPFYMPALLMSFILIVARLESQ